jgi:hypothetical protein
MFPKSCIGPAINKNYPCVSGIVISFISLLNIIGSIILIFRSLLDGETQFGVKQIAYIVTLLLGAYILERSINKIIND